MLKLDKRSMGVCIFLSCYGCDNSFPRPPAWPEMEAFFKVLWPKETFLKLGVGESIINRKLGLRLHCASISSRIPLEKYRRHLAFDNLAKHQPSNPNPTYTWIASDLDIESGSRPPTRPPPPHTDTSTFMYCYPNVAPTSEAEHSKF